MKEILSAIGKLSGKIDVMQEQVAKIPEIEKQIAKIPEMQNDIVNMKTDINNIKIDVNNIKIDVNNIKTDVNNIKTDVNNIKTDVNNIKTDVDNINKSVAVIEHEHGDKIKALFDAFITNNEKIYQEQERISFCERKLEKHDTEIYYLKTQVQGI